MPSSTLNTYTRHHIPSSEIIEISDSDGPDPPQFTGVNQASVKFSISSLATGQEVIEIMSSDAEDVPPPPCSPLIQTVPLPDIPQTLPERSREPTHAGGSPDLPDSTPIPPQSSFPPPPQSPEVSSPHEVENMMDVDDVIQHSPPPPPPPPICPSLHLPIPQADLTVDAIQRTFSNVTVTSSPTHPTHPPHAPDFVEDSEPEAGPLTELAYDGDFPQVIPTPLVENNTVQTTSSEEDFHPPPSTSPSSQSHQTSLSRNPTPTVRGLLYGGPNGIFRGANTSIVQHIWATFPQNTIPSPPASLPSIHPDEEPEIGLPPATNTIIPESNSLPGTVTAQVNYSILLLLTAI